MWGFGWLGGRLFGGGLFVLFAASAFRKLSSIYVFSYFPFGFEGRIWDLIVSVPDHCLSFYFAVQGKKWNKIQEKKSTKSKRYVKFYFREQLMLYHE